MLKVVDGENVTRGHVTVDGLSIVAFIGLRGDSAELMERRSSDRM
jgi:hypothetical protein